MAELFTNYPTTTVTTGGTDAPASGTVETIVVASSASFPAVTTASGNVFHFADQAAPTEIMTATNVSGTTWTITRGAEGTTPVTHLSGYTIKQVVTAGALRTFQTLYEWINAVVSYGADPTGTNDSAAAINNAVTAANALPNGGVVYLPSGTYLIQSPIILLPGVTLRGSHPWGQGWWANWGTTIQMAASPNFTIGSAPLLAAIAMGPTGGTSGTNGAVWAQCGIINLLISGQSSGGQQGADGIGAIGNVSALTIREVAIHNVPGNGIAGYRNSAAQSSSSSPHQDDWTCADVAIINAGTNPTNLGSGTGLNGIQYQADGFQLTGNDHSFENVHAQQCGQSTSPAYGNGFNVQGSNIRMGRCRAEINGLDGFLWSSLVGGGDWSGITFTNCSTQGNNNNGARITNTAGGGQQLNNSVQFSGCRFEGDGKNNGSGGGGFAGIRVEGGNQVTIADTDVLVKTNSVSTGCPQWSLATGTAGSGGVPNLVQAYGGFWSCVPGSGSVLWNDAAPSKLLSISVHGYFGTAGNPQPANNYVPVFYTNNAPSISGQYLCAPTVYAPGTLTTPQVTTTTMAAFDSTHITTGSFVAPASGSVVVTVSFVGRASAASAYSAFGLAAHGTVTPIVASEVQTEVSSSGTAIAYNLEFVVTGLTAGTSYQFDLLGCVTSGNTFTIDAIGTTSTTPTLGTGGQGSPVILMVQAV